MTEKDRIYRKVDLGLFMSDFCSYNPYARNLPKLISSAEQTLITQGQMQ